MRRPSTTWSVVALSLALAALGLPATSADAQSARVAVAGAEQIPSADVVLSQAITTALTNTSPLTFSNLVALPNVVTRTGYVDANNMVEITIKNRNAA